MKLPISSPSHRARRFSVGLPLLAALAALPAITSCTSDVDNVFGDSAAHRMAQSQNDYYAILEGSQQGWALDFYPADRIEGGVAYTARFKDGKVTMSCEQDINNAVVSKKFAKGTEVTSDYQIVSETGVMLTFNTYNALFHYWSQPFQGHAKGYESDYEFTFLSACADSVVLRGKKHGNILRMYPLQQSASDYVAKVADMHATLAQLNRKRAVVDGQEVPVTMAYNLLTYSDEGTTHAVPFIHTPDGIRFYEPVTMQGAVVRKMTFDATSRELRSDDGHAIMPNPTPVERLFIATTKQWLFTYSWSSGVPSDMCDELAAIIRSCADVVNNGTWGERVRELYLGANMESFANDRHRWVLGWHTRMSGAIDYYVGYAVAMELIGTDPLVADIQMLEGANLFSNYGYWQPFVDFVAQHSPYLLTFNDAANPTEVTLTSQNDSTKWFKLKMKK